MPDSKIIKQSTPQDKSNSPDLYLARALRHLEEPSDQPWTLDNRFILAGRQKMKSYPHIMISPDELADVIRTFEQTLPDVTLWRQVFLKVETHLKTYVATGRSIQTINPFLWLTGWCLNETLETACKSQRLKNGGQKRPLR